MYSCLQHGRNPRIALTRHPSHFVAEKQTAIQWDHQGQSSIWALLSAKVSYIGHKECVIKSLIPVINIPLTKQSLWSWPQEKSGKLSNDHVTNWNFLFFKLFDPNVPKRFPFQKQLPKGSFDSLSLGQPPISTITRSEFLQENLELFTQTPALRQGVGQSSNNGSVPRGTASPLSFISRGISVC